MKEKSQKLQKMIEKDGALKVAMLLKNI
jgi:hypothetical protein